VEWIWDAALIKTYWEAVTVASARFDSSAVRSKPIGFRDLTPCDLKKFFSVDKTVEITSHVRFPNRV